MPETRTITQTVYTYDELDDDAKQRVAEWLNDDPFMIQNDIELFIDPDPDYANYPPYVLPTYHDVRLMNGKTRRQVDHYAEWSDPYHLSIGYVFDLPAFMRHHKIAGRLRATYNAATEGYVTADVIRNRWGYGNTYDVLNLDADYWDNAERYADQLDQLRELLESDMQNRIDELSNRLRDECEYHWSPRVYQRNMRRQRLPLHRRRRARMTEDATPGTWLLAAAVIALTIILLAALGG